MPNAAQPSRRGLTDEERDDHVGAIDVISKQLNWNVAEMRTNVDIIMRLVRDLKKR